MRGVYERTEAVKLNMSKYQSCDGNGNAKYTPELINYIRQHPASDKTLEHLTGVSRRYINMIRNYQRWKNLKKEN